jgi:hypothetical protein
VLYEGTVPQVAENEGQDEQVQEKHHNIVSEISRAARTYNTFHF